jgi:Protein of unknown function (DUF2608)
MINKGVERTIAHIPEMRAILSGLSYDSIVVWDMDNTILKSRHELGSDQWFGALVGIAKTKHGAQFEFDLLITTYNQVQAFTELVEIEEKTIKIIERLHRIGIPQILLTARNGELFEVTMRQLDSCGIYFNPSHMIFCDGQDKGLCLENFLSNLVCPIPHIVMIDDKKYNVESVRDAAIRMNARFNGFVYEFLNAEVQSFDVQHANFQLSFVMHLLDETAKRFVESLDLTWEDHHAKANQTLKFHQMEIITQEEEAASPRI